MDGHIRFPDDFDAVAVNFYGGGFIDAYSYEAGCGDDEILKVVLAVAHQDMLVDCAVFEKAQTLGMVTDQDAGAGCISAPKERSLYACTRR